MHQTFWDPVSVFRIGKKKMILEFEVSGWPMLNLGRCTPIHLKARKISYPFIHFCMNKIYFSIKRENIFVASSCLQIIKFYTSNSKLSINLYFTPYIFILKIKEKIYLVPSNFFAFCNLNQKLQNVTRYTSKN